jgi:endonuclease/exonuclease/phosphatase family metal-dependent hydrolase
MSLKLVSLNIEGQKHLGKVKTFLEAEKADVVCLMEVFEDTLDTVTKGYEYSEFAPGYLADQDSEMVIPGERVWGEVIMSHYPIKNVQKIYLGNHSELNLPKKANDTHAPVLIVADIEHPDTIYRVATVHGTWTKGGLVNERQLQEMGKLIEVLKGQELVLCGDFNVVRNNEMYKKLTAVFKDNIPSSITTTIDPLLHYANKEQRGRLSLVVDYIFSTPSYKVSGLRVESGISDHCGLVAIVEK